MGRKRKVPLSYKLRPWYKGDISSSDSDSENADFVPQPKIQALVPQELPSDAPSNPMSDVPESGSPRSSLPWTISSGAVSDPGSSSQHDLSDQDPCPPRNRKRKLCLSPALSRQSALSPRSESPPPQSAGSELPPGSIHFVEEPDRKNYYQLLDELANDWLNVENLHNVSKTATNCFWAIATEKIHELFEVKNFNGIRRKTPQFQQLRNKLNSKLPPIKMEIGYLDRHSGDLIVEDKLETTPVKLYPPSQFQKTYEIATVKVQTFKSMPWKYFPKQYSFHNNIISLELKNSLFLRTSSSTIFISTGTN